ncbi:uncharacterized protein LOC134729731 [Pan paniscus]|uniref:uncharacterized protein LOC134729731 n=1 Tax=Pan paniscus TaxID=9597 RepID=UPI003007057F
MEPRSATAVAPVTPAYSGACQLGRGLTKPSPAAPWPRPSSLRMREDKCLLLKPPGLWSPCGCSSRTKTLATPGFSTAAAATRRRPPPRVQTQVHPPWNRSHSGAMECARHPQPASESLPSPTALPLSHCHHPQPCLSVTAVTHSPASQSLPSPTALPLSHCCHPQPCLSVPARHPQPCLSVTARHPQPCLSVPAVTLAAPGVAQKWNCALGCLRAQPRPSAIPPCCFAEQLLAAHSWAGPVLATDPSCCGGSLGGGRGCRHILAVTNKAAVNIPVHVVVWNEFGVS